MILFILGISVTLNLVFVASAILYFQTKEEKKDDKILSRSTCDFTEFWR